MYLILFAIFCSVILLNKIYVKKKEAKQHSERILHISILSGKVIRRSFIVPLSPQLAKYVSRFIFA